MLVLVCGLPATGKSTVARRLARSLGAELLRTDVVRKELIGRPRYTEEEKELVYRALFLIAERLLKNDVNVILDGTFYKRSLRDEARRIAEKQGKRFFLIETTCPEEVVAKRLARRSRSVKSASDADLEVYRKLKAVFERIEEEHIVIETGWNMKEGVKEAVKAIRG